MDENKDVDVERRVKKSDSSKVGVALIKYGAYLVIFFGILWFIIKFVFPMF